MIHWGGRSGRYATQPFAAALINKSFYKHG
jgi:hypothetical protein